MTRRFEVGPLLVALGAAILLVSLLVAEVIDPPPTAAGEDLEAGAWFAFGAVFLMCAGALLTFGRISFALSVEARDVRERVPVVDHRQDTTETAAVKADEEPPERR